MLAGCHDPSPPPPRVVVPGADYRQPVARQDEVKPMPPIAQGPVEPQTYNDEPLLVQRPPEQRAFVDAYNRVGHPRIAIFVNRTLNGQVVPVNDGRPLGEVEQHPTNSNGGSTKSPRNRIVRLRGHGKHPHRLARRQRPGDCHLPDARPRPPDRKPDRQARSRRSPCPLRHQPAASTPTSSSRCRRIPRARTMALP